MTKFFLISVSAIGELSAQNIRELFSDTEETLLTLTSIVPISEAQLAKIRGEE